MDLSYHDAGARYYLPSFLILIRIQSSEAHEVHAAYDTNRSTDHLSAPMGNGVASYGQEVSSMLCILIVAIYQHLSMPRKRSARQTSLMLRNQSVLGLCLLLLHLTTTMQTPLAPSDMRISAEYPDCMRLNELEDVCTLPAHSSLYAKDDGVAG